MAFDFKKEYKEFYQPKNTPQLVTIPPANYIAVQGKGDPNEEGGDYQKAVGILYAVAYIIKMSYKGEHKIDGFFQYVVPPLEGFWWNDQLDQIGNGDKSGFHWISVIRLPDFVKQEDFDWAIGEAQKKKNLDCTTARFLTVDEGLCVQAMHVGSYDEEPATVAAMDQYAISLGFESDLNTVRLHHEIYLSAPRKTEVSKQKTVIRHPVKPRA